MEFNFFYLIIIFIAGLFIINIFIFLYTKNKNNNQESNNELLSLRESVEELKWFRENIFKTKIEE